MNGKSLEEMSKEEIIEDVAYIVEEANRLYSDATYEIDHRPGDKGHTNKVVNRIEIAEQQLDKYRDASKTIRTLYDNLNEIKEELQSGKGRPKMSWGWYNCEIDPCWLFLQKG